MLVLGAPIVSVIVPCFNQAEYLPEALDSLLAQSLQNWEAIVIDDGSPDNVAEVAEKYAIRDSRIQFIHSENQGVSYARNIAIRKYSSGTYILPLDGDDRISSTYLAHSVDYMEKHPDCKLVYGLAEKFGAENEIWALPDYSFQGMLFENLIYCTALFRRTDFDRTKGYNTNMREGLEDWDFWLSFLGPSDKVHRLDELVFSYRIKEESRNTEAIKEARFQSLRRQIYDNHKEYYAEYVQDIITYVRRCNSLQLYIDKLENSPTMKVGRVFTMPVRLIRGAINVTKKIGKK